MPDRFFNTILVPTDFSDKARVSLHQAIRFAKALNLNITLLHVVEQSGFLSSLFTESQNKELMILVQQNLDELSSRLSKEHGIVINTMIEKGKIYHKILDIANLISARFIMLGANSNSIDEKRAFIGTQAARIIREAGCPVIVHHNEANFDKGIETIVLPLDLTKQTTLKVEKAIEMARCFGSTIKVMSASLTDDIDVNNHLKDQIEKVRLYIEERNIFCTSELVPADLGQNSIAKVIIEYCKTVNADLIMIMTQQEKNWVKYFVGSAAQEVMRNSEVPVMTITPEIYEKKV